MKTAIQIILLTVVIFATVILLTKTEMTPVDGTNEYGYPFLFYIYFSGETGMGSLFLFPEFIYNLLIWAAVAFLLVVLKNKFVQRLSKSK